MSALSNAMLPPCLSLPPTKTKQNWSMQPLDLSQKYDFTHLAVPSIFLFQYLGRKHVPIY